MVETMLKLKKIKRSLISTKLLLWFLLISLIPLAVVGYVTFNIVERVTKQEVVEGLQSIIEHKVDHLNGYILEREMDVDILAHTPAIRDAMEGFTLAFERGGNKSSGYNVVEKKFISHFHTVIIDFNATLELSICACNLHIS